MGYQEKEKYALPNHKWKSSKKWKTQKKKNMPCQTINGKTLKMGNPEKVEYAM